MAKPTPDFPALCKKLGIPAPVAEHKFHPRRKWRMDYAWPDAKIFLEVEGGVWSGGRHTSPKGYLGDMQKYNEAACLGWRKLACVPKELITVRTVDMVRRAMEAGEVSKI
jgi:hypothetical protein